MNLQSVAHLAPVTLADRLFTIGVLGTALILLLVVSVCVVPDLLVAARRWFAPRRVPDLHADLRKDWQTPARRLKLATLNCPAAKQWDAKHTTPLQTVQARTDPGRRPLPVAVELTGALSSDHQATVVHFTTRKGQV